MNINEHDKKEIKGCMKMKEEIEITPLQIANAINNLFLEKDDLFVKLERSKKEITRLNNIINELEKWLEELNKPENDMYGYHKQLGIKIDIILNKLKELKGDKE